VCPPAGTGTLIFLNLGTLHSYSHQISPVTDIDLEAVIPNLVSRLSLLSKDTALSMEEQDLTSQEPAVSSTMERPKSPWTPSYSVTTHESVSLPDATNITSLEHPDDISVPLEILTSPQADSERPRSPWTPSYSTIMQGSGVTSHIEDSESSTTVDVIQSPGGAGLAGDRDISDTVATSNTHPDPLELQELAAVPSVLLHITDDPKIDDQPQVTPEIANTAPSVDLASEVPMISEVSWNSLVRNVPFLISHAAAARRDCGSSP
jgi:hypothetical protein